MYDEIKNTFLYFAYGSNLFKKRIRINNPTAEFLGIGRLEGHVLDFIKYSPNWRGASATIVPTDITGAHVWGAIWRINNQDMPALDRQEGVDTNWYFPKTIHVITPEFEKVECRTYQQTENPEPLKDGEELPMERRPCITYLDIIIKAIRHVHNMFSCGLNMESFISFSKLYPGNMFTELFSSANPGAIECGIPPSYIEQLKKIPHNGQEASPEMIDKLNKM